MVALPKLNTQVDAMTARWMLSMSTAMLVACAGTDVPQDESRQAADAPTAQSGQRAFVDPQTGELIPPPAGSKASGTGPAKAAGYSLHTQADGTIELRPKQPTRHRIDAQQAEDGSLDYEEPSDAP